MYLKSALEKCKQASFEIFKNHSGKENLTLEDKTEVIESKNIWNAFIFVGGTKFRSMFVTEFSTITLLNLASERFSDVNESDYIKNVKDFMREYCNQFAGKIKASFELETDAYLSLPVITKSYDLENIFGISEKEIEQASWSIGDGPMRVGVDFYYYEKEKFENYNFIEQHLDNNNSNSDIEFF